MTNIDIGINEQDRINIAEGLKRVLADSYTLYTKTQFSLEHNGPTISGFALDVRRALHRISHRCG